MRTFSISRDEAEILVDLIEANTKDLRLIYLAEDIRERFGIVTREDEAVTVADAIDHLNKPLGVNIPEFIRHRLEKGMIEVSQDDFEAFVSRVNYRRDLIGGIRKYFLVSNGREVAFYVHSQSQGGIFFIDPTGNGLDWRRGC